MAKQFEYNSILTERGFDSDSDRFVRGRKADDVCDASGKILGSVSKTGLFDLFGGQIAQTVTDENGAEGKTVYESDSAEYLLENDRLYRVGVSNTYLGRVIRKERNYARISVLAVLAALLAATVVLIALIGLPFSDTVVPTINVSDTDGEWTDKGAVVIFGDKLRPGDKGEYKFVLSNANDSDMLYSFNLIPHYDGKADAAFPIMFRLKMNNVIMETTEWKTVDMLKYEDMVILQGSSQTFTLEWEWPFDGDNANDTLIGADGGKISLTLRLTAQAR